MRAILTRLFVLMVLGVVAASCSSGRAQQVVEDRPTLVVPPVPPRSIEPPPPTEPPVIEPVPDIPPPSAPPAKPKPTATRNSTEAKPDPNKQEPLPDVATGTAPPPQPVPNLRTPTTPSGPEATRQIRDILQRADGLLNRVDYQKLSDDRKANYNTAKQWILQADEALKKEDLTLARSFAERAENVAKQLEAGR